jgi:hypothetical protein
MTVAAAAAAVDVHVGDECVSKGQALRVEEGAGVCYEL